MPDDPEGAWWFVCQVSGGGFDPTALDNMPLEELARHYHRAVDTDNKRAEAMEKR